MTDVESIAVFPGSFDPLTNGHFDIINRALKVFPKVHVAVLNNSSKGALFTSDERVDLIQQVFREDSDRVIVSSFNGLLVDYVNKIGANVVIRGLRAISDYDYEAQMALMNRSLAENIETLFLMATAKNSYVSSTLVKQVAPFGGDVSNLVHPIIQTALEKKYCK